MNALEELQESAALVAMGGNPTVRANGYRALLDKFITSLEAVEVTVGRMSGRYYDPRDLSHGSVHATIYVPRKQQTLAEAAEKLSLRVRAMSAGEHSSPTHWRELYDAERDLTAALKREADNARD